MEEFIACAFCALLLFSALPIAHCVCEAAVRGLWLVAAIPCVQGAAGWSVCTARGAAHRDQQRLSLCSGFFEFGFAQNLKKKRMIVCNHASVFCVAVEWYCGGGSALGGLGLTGMLAYV